MIRKKIKEIAKNIDKFSFKLEDKGYIWEKYIFKYKKLKIYFKSIILFHLYFCVFLVIHLIPLTNEEEEFLKKVLEKRVEENKRKEKLKQKKEEEKKFKEGTKLLDKINFN